MSLEDRGAQHDKIVVDKYHGPIANYTMTTRDYILRPAAGPATGAFTITLPPVTEAKGRFYSLIARDADGTNTITIQDRDESECWDGDITFNGKCDKVLLYSDGLAWLVLASVLTATGTTAAPTTIAPTTIAPTTLATTVAPTTAAPTTLSPTTAA